MDEKEWSGLLHREPGYRARPVVVLCDGHPVEAQALFLEDEERLPAPRIPSRRYTRILLDGAKEHHLPQSWLAHLDDLARQGPRLTSVLSILTRPTIRLVPLIGLPAALTVSLFILLLILGGALVALERFVF
jgi:hypothetical protein